METNQQMLVFRYGIDHRAVGVPPQLALVNIGNWNQPTWRYAVIGIPHRATLDLYGKLRTWRKKFDAEKFLKAYLEANK
jgi:hypothetical protein